MKTNKLTGPPMTLAWFIWGLGALFYLAGFFQRVAPAVMTQELMQDFHISASGLGHLSGLYFYAYVAMQIPTGILADTLGPRKLLTAGCLVAGLGTLLFALSPGFFWAGLGRLLIGGSVAVAFVGLLKLSSSWFPKNFYAFVAGNALSIGLIGAVTAGPPLRFHMDTFHWRQVIGVTGVMTLVLGGLIWFVVRDWPQEKGYPGFTKKIPTPASLSVRIIQQGLFNVLKYRNTWLLFVIPGGIVGCILTFSGLWGVPYLITHHQLNPGRAAALSSVLLIGWALGAPVFGWLSDRMGNRKPLYILGSMVVALGWSLILFRENLSLSQLVMALFVTGFFSGCMILSFAFAMESVPLSLSGTVSGLINMGVMMGPMLLQPDVSRLMDNNWTGQLVNGARVYSLDAYEVGFIPMMAWIILSVLLLFFTRETHCRQIA
ncbi:MAG: MFS transporter [Desulfobacula sp.]|uniref:MFS transporter n=1 Tax=Desulfobacula sp. TaxID=2593537 RepID=UPI0025BFF22D|nr:MFS transporter [Desulfobacula sp.]MCD4722777.1 MFS transporter [Desulfobacula sp.]